MRRVNCILTQNLLTTQSSAAENLRRGAISTSVPLLVLHDRSNQRCFLPPVAPYRAVRLILRPHRADLSESTSELLERLETCDKERANARETLVLRFRTEAGRNSFSLRGRDLWVVARTLNLVKRHCKGYIRDRRRNSEADPYQIVSRILKTVDSVPRTSGLVSA
jgi:hypothetical protein